MGEQTIDQPCSRTFASLAEFEASVGQNLGTSQWRVISQADVDTFARVTNDWQWVHCHPEKAAQGPFGTTIAHGYFTMSLLSSFAQEIYKVEGISHVVNYGMDKLRFPAPLPVGSTIRAVAHLISVRNTGPHVMAAVHYEVQLRGSSKPVLIADTLVALVPSPAAKEIPYDV